MWGKMVNLLEKSPVQEGKYPVPEDVWYTDGSSRGSPCRWWAVTHHPLTETIWYEKGGGWSSQCAELQAVCMVITQELGKGTLNICTDSWVFYWGLTLWISTVGHSGLDNPCPTYLGQNYVGWYMERMHSLYEHITSPDINPCSCQAMMKLTHWLKLDGWNIHQQKTSLIGYIRN